MSLSGDWSSDVCSSDLVAGGHEPGVLDLLVAPQRGQQRALAGEQRLGQLAHAVHVEQRAIGIEQDGLGRWHTESLGSGSVRVRRAARAAGIVRREAFDYPTKAAPAVGLAPA